MNTQGFADRAKITDKKLSRDLFKYFNQLEKIFVTLQVENPKMGASHFIESFRHHKGTTFYRK